MASSNNGSVVLDVVDIVEENGNRLTVPISLLYKKMFSYVLPSQTRLELGYPIEITTCPGSAVILKTTPEKPQNIQLVDLVPEREERCMRCKGTFRIKNVNEYIKNESCRYHPQKFNYDQQGYLCCKRTAGLRGCANSILHVWSGICDGLNGPFNDYVRTRPPKEVPESGNYGIFAIDTQMCNTTAGFNVIEVTLVDVQGKKVYHAFVKPQSKVVDYNFQYSGINRKQFIRQERKRLEDVQGDLVTYVNSYSHIIEQGVENDLRCLKILHENIIDTSLLFPIDIGFPHRRRSLRELSESILKCPLELETGRKSFNNAKIFMDLTLFKVKSDIMVTYPP